MAAIYYNLVKAGRRELDQIPAHLREEVQAMLDAESSTD
ncbi:CD1375 family protein [Brevibacillus parabrevis]|nr:CD1375 family protein [Brevibacillus parabrevis]MDR4997907.1 CD1375 family protein [Brevibacillus parabrevis]